MASNSNGWLDFASFFFRLVKLTGLKVRSCDMCFVAVMVFLSGERSVNFQGEKAPSSRGHEPRLPGIQIY